MEVVTDEGKVLGTLTDVIETGANDVYAVKTPEGKEILLPAIRDCILDVNVDEKRMTVQMCIRDRLWSLRRTVLYALSHRRHLTLSLIHI